MNEILFIRSYNPTNIGPPGPRRDGGEGEGVHVGIMQLD